MMNFKDFIESVFVNSKNLKFKFCLTYVLIHNIKTYLEYLLSIVKKNLFVLYFPILSRLFLQKKKFCYQEATQFYKIIRFRRYQLLSNNFQFTKLCF